MLLLGGDPVEQGDDLLAAAQVEVGQRLVEQQQLGPADQGVGDEHPLLLAARQGPDPGVGEPLGIDRVRASRRPAFARACGRERDPEAVPVEAEGDQVPGPHRHVGIEEHLLGDVADRPVAAATRLARHEHPPGASVAAGRGSPAAAWSCPPRSSRSAR